MAAITKRLVLGMLAGAEINRLIPFGDILQGRKPGALVRSVAKWLRLTLAAGAPPIFVTLFDIHFTGFFLSNHRFGHLHPFKNRRQIGHFANSS